MTFTDRSRTRTLAARLAALFTGLWLFAALSPCVMAMDHACGKMDGGKVCAQAGDQCGLAAVDCELSVPNPPGSAGVDLPTPLSVVLSFHLVGDAPVPVRARHRAWSDIDLSGTARPLKHVRLLI